MFPREVAWGQVSLFSPNSKQRTQARIWALVHEQLRRCPEQFWSATAQKGIMPTRTHQEPSHKLQQNDKHCLKTCLLKALLVNGSLGKIVNTKHAVQLPESSAFLCAWAKLGYRRNWRVTKDAQQDFSNDVAPWPSCQQKLLGNSSDFCYWCKLSSLWSGAFIFNVLCTFPVLFKMPCWTL